MRRAHGLSAVIALAAAALAAAVAADRLVLEDGSSVETRGPWRVEGRLVIFHLPNGTLSSLRLGAVDFDASEAIRHRVRVAEPLASVAASAQPRPVLVVTDHDVERAAPPPGAGAAEDGSDEALGTDEVGSIADGTEALSAGGGDAIVIAAHDLEISAVEVNQDPHGGLEITGTLNNRGERIVTGVKLSVTVRSTYDSERTYQAILADNVLAGGGRSPFRILLPDVFSVGEDDLAFDLRGKAVRPRIIGSVFTKPADDGGEVPSGDQR